ncbi:hypothetical protein [Rhodoferax saidenbachensis]|uniref:Uncharacterized protein n=1 Tax=Rhodoferax saidenbachensis TaxID=1484693 RepID=A0ABU1ZRQ4_9BURK|nr:hypothetical protein [Rhodoferax saidenbachensis]MDR7308153.1 hypothetical protein [Rhodoferax saidenbachensis]
MYPYSPEPHRGIQASLAVSDDVIHLFVDAREAREYFFWLGSPTQKLKGQFPNLRKIIIQDDYLSQKQLDQLPIDLKPIAVEWTQGFYIDGRHGR